MGKGIKDPDTQKTKCKRRKVTGMIKPREANEFKFKHCSGGSWTNYQPSPKNHEPRRDVKPLGLMYTRKRPLKKNATKTSKIHNKTAN